MKSQLNKILFEKANIPFFQAMKYQFLLLSLLVFVTIQQDCNNPLLKPNMVGRLSEPILAKSDISFCPRLANKEICCSQEAAMFLINKVKKSQQTFEFARKKQMK